MPQAATDMRCDECGSDLLYVGKLPAIGGHPLVHVFKCRTCLSICAITADVDLAKDIRATARD